MDQPKPSDKIAKLLSDLPGYDPEPADGVQVNESPVPGLKLRRILKGDTLRINRIAWSPDGRFLAAPNSNHNIQIWDVERGKCVSVLLGHTGQVYCVSWSPDGNQVASCSRDSTIKIWDVKTNTVIRTLRGHTSRIYEIAWLHTGNKIASVSLNDAVRIWDVTTGESIQEIRGYSSAVTSVVWLSNGKTLALSSARQNDIFLWSSETQPQLSRLKGHRDGSYALALSPDKKILASGSKDNTIRLWDLNTRRELSILEGHTDEVKSISFSSDGNLLVSKSEDQTFRIWDLKSLDTLAVIKESTSTITWSSGLAFHPRLPIFATLGENDTIIRVWELDVETLLGQNTTKTIRYTTAKLVLVGDSGVGKTGLGWRLAHGDFKEHTSTHGQQFWVLDHLRQTRSDGTECEAVLWDLAGQHIYRPIHAIFLDNVDASLVLFDPTNRHQPLKGAEFWLEQLARNKQLPPSVLIGARLDRGTAVLSQEELAQFCQQYNISGGYIGTSAKEGMGLDQLLEILKQQIPWDQMTTTVTTDTFKRVKEYVLALKEKSDRKGVLVSPAALRDQIQATDQDWTFTDAEMMTAVGHLQNHGYVSILSSSSGEKHILLGPELLVDLASSIVLQADKHPRELGALIETELLQGHYPFAELRDLEKSEQQILLDAAVVRFLEHNICFRETLGNETLLIFPGLIKQKRPLQNGVEAVEDISYIVRGRVENIYPALVVLLGLTRTFTRINQWQRQAQYEMGDGNICGFRLIEDVEQEIELVLYYSRMIPDYGRRKFQGLFEELLYQRDVEVTPFPPVYCPDHHLQERSTVVKRRREGKRFLFCEECGKKIELIENQHASDPAGLEANWIQREEALARLRSTYETHLTRIKGFRRDRAAPRCYISHLAEQAAWASQLTSDLRDAGVFVIADRAGITEDDIILMADTPHYERVFREVDGPLAADAQLIRHRLEQGATTSIVRLLVESTIESLDNTNIQPGDFRTASHYAVSLFDLVLTLYAIPHQMPAFKPLRESLHRQWEKTLSDLPRIEEPTGKPLKIFISYQEEDKPFKDELVIRLAGLQKRGIVDAWEDGRIEAGEERHEVTQAAMQDCDLALLLVSPYFLASDFIQDETIPYLLDRRKTEGMQVVPIIIRHCSWDGELVLGDLQVLPRDGQPLNTFSADNGERDKVWLDITRAIAELARQFRSKP